MKHSSRPVRGLGFRVVLSILTEFGQPFYDVFRISRTWQKLPGENCVNIRVTALARRVLAISAMSEQSEQLFSEAGYIFMNRRAPLKAEECEAVTFSAHRVARGHGN